MWDLPGSETQSMSFALAGRFFTTEPPGNPPAFTNLPFHFWAGCRQQWGLKEQWNLKVEGLSGPEGLNETPSH